MSHGTTRNTLRHKNGNGAFRMYLLESTTVKRNLTIIIRSCSFREWISVTIGETSSARINFRLTSRTSLADLAVTFQDPSVQAMDSAVQAPNQ